MNPYVLLERAAGTQAHREFFRALALWHDEMVMHQRFVRRLGPAACSDECPHVEGRRLWQEARALLGAAADNLTFLRSCAGGTRPVPPQPTQPTAA